MSNLTISQLTVYRDGISAGGVAAARQVYSDLYAQGYNYAGWALGVATGNTITGQSALDYLGGTAMMGLGGDACRNLTSAQIDRIRMDMSLGYINTLIDVANNQNGVLIRDVSFKEAAAFHKSAFEKNNLTLDNWTLNLPMEIIRRQKGDQAVEDLWSRIRGTGGDGFDSLLISTGLANTVGHASVSPDPEIRQMAQDWIDKVPGVANWSQIRRFANAFSNAWSGTFNDWGDTITKVTNDLFLSARNWVAPRDPLVLDLDGDGIEAIGINSSRPILFDHDGDGTKNATGWISGDDGIVVLDRNGNGLIDSGRELFGDQTLKPDAGDGVTRTYANGYEALAAQDGNGDGVINANDAVYSQLRIWRDANQDGISQASEMRTLADSGIASISVVGVASNVNLGNGNTQPWSGSFTRTDGSEGSSGVAEVSGSLLLTSNNFYREFPDNPVITAAAAALPQMKGSGAVRDLQQAMSLGTAQSSDLQFKLSRYAAATTRDAQLALLDELVQSWGATSAMETSVQVNRSLSWSNNPSSETAVSVFAQNNPELYAKITTLERFNGDNFLSNRVLTQYLEGEIASHSIVNPPSVVQVTLIESAYSALKDSIYNSLVVQTRLRPYLDSVQLDMAGDELKIDFGALNRILQTAHDRSAVAAVGDLMDIRKIYGDLFEGVGWSSVELLAKWIPCEVSNNGVIKTLADFGLILKATESGGDSNEILVGGLTGEINGGGGNDVLLGGDGDDVLNGGAGADVLYGGLGSDTYIFGLGGGLIRFLNPAKIGLIDRIMALRKMPFKSIKCLPVKLMCLAGGMILFLAMSMERMKYPLEVGFSKALKGIG